MTILVAISLAIIMILGSVSLGFSESEPENCEMHTGWNFDTKRCEMSLKNQILLLETDQIRCNNPNQVLVERINGNTACVYESTAEKLGWKIIIPVETIPNPTGYWIPIPEEDREDFIKKMVIAAGDSIRVEYQYGGFLTKYGMISEDGQRYVLDDLVVKDKKKFTENFMKSMGFDYENNYLQYIDGYFSDTYRYTNEFSLISFQFDRNYESGYNPITIKFSGWTNNPELIVFPLSEELAVEKALALTKDLYAREDCGDVEIDESPYVRRYVSDGSPFYEMQTGSCNTEESLQGLTSCKVTVRINAMNQTDYSTNVWCWNE